jgi:hypothetical protein
MDTSMSTDMGTAGPVITIGVTSRAAVLHSGSSDPRSAVARSVAGLSVGGAVAVAAGGGRGAVTYALRSWRC